MSDRKFLYAGVSQRDGQFHLRASNREIYDEILKRDKDTRINIIKLSKPMTKDEIRATLVRRKDFQSPAILKVLSRGEDAPAKAAKKKPARRKAVKSEPAAAAA
jgi:hypothetical protein